VTVGRSPTASVWKRTSKGVWQAEKEGKEVSMSHQTGGILPSVITPSALAQHEPKNVILGINDTQDSLKSAIVSINDTQQNLKNAIVSINDTQHNLKME
jgi:hypothetical protein